MLLKLFQRADNGSLMVQSAMSKRKAEDIMLISKSHLFRILSRGIFVVLIFFVVVVLAFSFWIELELKNICKTATQKYPGDKIEALMMSVETKKYGLDAHLYKANNRFIWALGQLGDERALHFLRNLVTGEPCNHETNLCQGEIKDAIQKLETHQFNLPKFLWRNILNP
jgi:hypothetical protein